MCNVSQRQGRVDERRMDEFDLLSSCESCETECLPIREEVITPDRCFVQYVVIKLI